MKNPNYQWTLLTLKRIIKIESDKSRPLHLKLFPTVQNIHHYPQFSQTIHAWYCLLSADLSALSKISGRYRPISTTKSVLFVRKKNVWGALDSGLRRPNSLDAYWTALVMRTLICVYQAVSPQQHDHYQASSLTKYLIYARHMVSSVRGLFSTLLCLRAAGHDSVC